MKGQQTVDTKKGVVLPVLGEAGLSSGKASSGSEKTEKGGEEPDRV